MSKIDYKKIEDIIKRFYVLNNERYYDSVELLKYISTFFSDSKYCYNSTVFINNHIDINESIKIVCDFLKEIDINLYYNFIDLMYFCPNNMIFYNKQSKNELLEFKHNNNLISETSYEFYKEKYNHLSNVNYNGIMTINYENNINDVFTIVHELVHKIYLENKNLSLYNDYDYLFFECPAMIIEFMLYDYLIKNNIYIKEANEYIHNRISSIRNYANNILFRLMLIEIIKKYDMINSNLIDQEIENLEDSELKEDFYELKESYYLDIIQNRKFDIFTPFQYEMGLYISLYLVKKYKTKTLLKYINILSRMAFNNCETNKELNKCNLYFIEKIEDSTLYINKQVLEEMNAECIKSEINNLEMLLKYTKSE